jgi:hypothetical protein
LADDDVRDLYDRLINIAEHDREGRLAFLRRICQCRLLGSGYATDEHSAYGELLGRDRAFAERVAAVALESSTVESTKSLEVLIDEIRGLHRRARKADDAT